MNEEHCDILLATLNARYGHTAFGLRYLLANMGPLRDRTQLLEFNIQQPADQIVERLVREKPAILGLGVYIWNVAMVMGLLPRLRQSLPKTLMVLGGPEASYDPDPRLEQQADYILFGEGDLAFAELCGQLLAGSRPANKILRAPPPELEGLALPYDLYSGEDIAHRTIYVETSRGCPYACEYCLSSRDTRVRYFPMPALLTQFERLLERGVQQFKFTDRALNLNIDRCRDLLEFFLAHYRPGVFLHLEMMPDRFPDSLKEILTRIPASVMQCEIGVQTMNADVASRIQRVQDMGKTLENIRFLRTKTHIYLHADLIAGLPGESMDSFAQGFDQLAAAGPHEIQLGILKRLRGSAISRHDENWKMHYNAAPPYNLLSHSLIPVDDMRRIEHFAHYWDLISNSGNFIESSRFVWLGKDSVFHAFMKWSDWLFSRVHRVHGIPLTQLAEYLFHFITTECQIPAATVGPVMLRDYQRGQRRDIPSFLRPFASQKASGFPCPKYSVSGLKRQARHWAYDLEKEMKQPFLKQNE
ncbi:MAG: radical SAM protein [Lentisphaerota bacterium]